MRWNGSERSDISRDALLDQVIRAKRAARRVVRPKCQLKKEVIFLFFLSCSNFLLQNNQNGKLLSASNDLSKSLRMTTEVKRLKKKHWNSWTEMLKKLTINCLLKCQMKIDKKYKYSILPGKMSHEVLSFYVLRRWQSQKGQTTFLQRSQNIILTKANWETNVWMSDSIRFFPGRISLGPPLIILHC